MLHGPGLSSLFQDQQNWLAISLAEYFGPKLEELLVLLGMLFLGVLCLALEADE